MKRPWLAAVLNIFPGAGYLYIDYKRPFGWLLAAGTTLFIISSFDSSQAYNAWVNTPYTWWDWAATASIIIFWIAFVMDGHLEATRANRGLSKGQFETVAVGQLQNAIVPRGAMISPAKFVFLSFVTFGLYQAYWAWRLWEIVRRSKGETYQFNSSLRAFFMGFSNFWLFPLLRDLAKQKGHKTTANVHVLAGLYLVITWIPFGFLVATLLLLPIVKMQNHYVAKTKAKFAPTKPNWWLIAALIIFSLSLGVITVTSGGWQS